MNTIISILLGIILVCNVLFMFPYIVIFIAIKRDSVWIPKAVEEKILKGCTFYRELSTQCRDRLDAEIRENYELKAKVADLQRDLEKLKAEKCRITTASFTITT